MKKERREYEIRAAEESDEMIVEGYAIVFEQPATHGFTEIIDRHALDDCDMSDCVLRYNHNDTQLSMARTRNKSLELTVDDHGLKFRAKLIDTQQNKDIYKMVQNGLLDKCSFAFTVTKESWDDETETRRVLKIDKLYDISLVDVPFYETTEVYARSLDDYKKIAFEKEKIRIMLSL